MDASNTIEVLEKVIQKAELVKRALKSDEAGGWLGQIEEACFDFLQAMPPVIWDK